MHHAEPLNTTLFLGLLNLVNSKIVCSVACSASCLLKVHVLPNCTELNYYHFELFVHSIR
jgi:hypothetical protein